MLQKSFFKVDVVDKLYDTLLLTQNTIGAYTYSVPDKYNYVVIEYAGASGGHAAGAGAGNIGGEGAVFSKKIHLTNHLISGIVGEAGHGYNSHGNMSGGSGYHAGENGADIHIAAINAKTGGGGGSTSIKVNNTTYEACGGGGAGSGVIVGGKGGGPYGGEGVNRPANNATDPGMKSLNSGNGYVKIWGGYDPYYKG